MVLTASNMLEIGTKAPGFSLPDTNGKNINLDELIPEAGLLVVFMCNHCPYVKHIGPELAAIGREYASKGIIMVAINANDAATHPDDSYEKMQEEVKKQGYRFPYLYDASQEVAKMYQAACTPDIFLFDSRKLLVYRGQLDDSRPGNNIPVTGKDLRYALDALIKGDPVTGEQKPSMGCNIKWKPGNEPRYFSAS